MRYQRNAVTEMQCRLTNATGLFWMDGGEDFDPDVVDAFLADKSKVEKIYFLASAGDHT